jgi:hypothetical protein
MKSEKELKNDKQKKRTPSSTLFDRFFVTTGASSVSAAFRFTDAFY